MGSDRGQTHGESDMSCQKCVGAAAGCRRCRGAMSSAGSALGLGGIALANLVNRACTAPGAQDRGILGGQLHVPARAKRVIYLFMAGGPSQMETFDYKPVLGQRNGEQLPDSVRQGQRLTGMSGNQSSLPLAGSKFGFSRHGANGTWVSDLLPHTARIVDDLCIVRSMYTEAINHDPAITFFQTGSQIAGRPSMGAVDSLRARQRQRRSARVRRPDHARARSISPCTRVCGAAVSCQREHQGVQFRSGQGSGALSGEP